VTPEVLADIQRVLAADAAIAAEQAEIIAQRETEQAQRRANREAERETQRARREAERALLVQAKETLKANRRARKAACQAGEEGPETMTERAPLSIAARAMAKDGYCTEVLAYAIMTRRDHEKEPEEWQRNNPLWVPPGPAKPPRLLLRLR
jgi:hypothetical protein